MTRGFTLIEIIVAIAIISILAGILVPLTYRSLETAEEEATRQKMNLLKQAMTGDPQLIQNGIRTNFGFAGDVGSLPRDAANLSFAGTRAVSDDLYNATNAKLLYPNWNGPYVVETTSGDYGRDSWGREFIYNITPTTDLQGRRVVATLRSAGFDGIPENADDLVVSIYEEEVTPAERLHANINFSFRNHSSGQISKVCSVKLDAKYNEPTGTKILALGCRPFSANISAGGILPVTVPFNVNLKDIVNAEFRLPVGRMEIRPSLYQTDDKCSSTVKELDPAYVYVHDRMKTIPVNLPIISWTF